MKRSKLVSPLVAATMIAGGSGVLAGTPAEKASATVNRNAPAQAAFDPSIAGYDWNPRTQALWGMDHGSDFRGDAIPPEELNEIRDGANYGWPICYDDRIVDDMTNAMPKMMALKPGQEQPTLEPLTRTDYCLQTEPATLSTTAHSAPMAMRFYQGWEFPIEFRNDAFVAMRGSWNAATPVGYKVVRVRFSNDGRPDGFEDFLTGFIDDEGAMIYGRPVGIAFTPGGSLLVSDDTNGALYLVRYQGH